MSSSPNLGKRRRWRCTEGTSWAFGEVAETDDHAVAVVSTSGAGPRPQNTTVPPPSITSVVPLMKDAAGLSRKAMARATSSGRPSRPSGVRPTSMRPYSACVMSPTRGVSITLGATALARQRPAALTAWKRVSPAMAALPAPYQPFPAAPGPATIAGGGPPDRVPATDATLTTAAPGGGP